ncbi:MAG: PAS domain S-box protein [Methanomethylovorans sp.]|nr:PAS domain S-box protein [Methanomethylovorans sp.]
MIVENKFSDPQCAKSTHLSLNVDMLRRLLQDLENGKSSMASFCFEAMGAMVVVLDRDMCIKHTSNRASQMLVCPGTEIKGMDWFEFFVPEYVRDAVREKCNSFFSGIFSFPMEIECALITNTGEYPYCWKVYPLKTTEECTECLLMILEDGSSSRCLDEQVHRMEKKYTSFMHNFKGILFQADPGYNVHFIAGAIQNITGYEKGDFLSGRIKWTQLLHPDDLSSFKSHAEKAISIPGYSGEHSYRIVRIDDRVKWVNIHLHYACCDVGDQGCLQAIVYDISNLKQAEELVIKERNKAHQYIDAAGSLIGVVDNDMEIVLVNKKACEVLGYAENEVLGRNWFDAFLPDRVRDITKENFKKVIAGEMIPPSFMENYVQTRSGEERLILWHDVVLRDDSGRIMGTISSGEDITERKKKEVELAKAYEELKSMDKMKDEFLSNLSHELKTPLISIKGYSELLDEGVLGSLNDKQKKATGAIVRNSIRLKRLIDSLLFLNIVNAGKAKYKFDPVCLKDLVDQALYSLDSQIKQSRINVECNVSSSEPMVRADQDYLPQVLLHIIENAIKFTAAGGSVFIGVKRERNCLHMQVKDTGIGISQAQLGEIFKKFYQIDGSMTRRYGGTGLGLYICKTIIDAHGGQIWIESQEHVGTTVHITFPLYQ